MAKILGPKCKLCRREGVKLYLRGERCDSPKCAIVKRNYPPGMHGMKGKTKLTPYGVQLREKQRAKRYYGLLERQFRNYFEAVSQKRGNTGEQLVQMLESRLDTLVFRFGFARSTAQARELVSHGHFLVNGKPVNIPSYRLEPGDTVEVHEKSKKMKYFTVMSPLLEKYQVPDWVSLDPKALKAKYLQNPTLEQSAPVFDVKRIVEFYSR